MRSGKTSDPHVNIEAKLETWPDPIRIQTPVFASIVRSVPHSIAVISRHIGEDKRHLKLCELLCRELGVVHTTRCDDTECVEVVHLRIQAIENERQEI